MFCLIYLDHIRHKRQVLWLLNRHNNKRNQFLSHNKFITFCHRRDQHLLQLLLEINNVSLCHHKFNCNVIKCIFVFLVEFHQFQVSQATGQPIFNPPVPPPTVMQAYHHPQQIPAVQPQTYQTSQLRMFDVQQQQHVTQYIVQQPPTSTTPSPGQPTVFHPGPQPSPAAGPPQAFQPQQYVMLMPPFPPQYVNQNQHNPQQLQVVMQPQQSAQHPQ